MTPGLKDAIDLSVLKRALVVKLRHHGDVLLTSPVFTSLKEAAPGVEIDALVYADTRPMLDGHPSISEVFGVGRDWKNLSFANRLGKELQLLRSLRARRYELILHLSEHPRGAWLARVLGCRYAVAPDYGGRSKFWRNSFSHRVSLAKNARRHMVEWNLDALRRIGVYPSEQRDLVLVPGDQAEREAENILARHGLQKKGFVHLHPASRWPFKCWTPNRYAALIRTLMRRGDRVVITAAPDEWEKNYVEIILGMCEEKPISLAGQLSLKSLAALTSRAKVFVGVDSAPMHIAAAMAAPVVALFGPSGEAEWGPWGRNTRVVSSSRFPCRPCGVDGCGGGKHSECLATLSEADVLKAMDEVLSD